MFEKLINGFKQGRVVSPRPNCADAKKPCCSQKVFLLGGHLIVREQREKPLK